MNSTPKTSLIHNPPPDPAHIFVCGIFNNRACIFIHILFMEDEVPFQLFSESRSYNSRSNSTDSGSAVFTSNHYDLSKVKRMISTHGHSKGNDSWSTYTGYGGGWYDKNGVAITELNQNDVEINVEAIARNRNLTDCYYYAWTSGSFRNLWEASDGYGYMFVTVSATVTITEGLPRVPKFISNLPCIY